MNLLKETLDDIVSSGHTPDDVVFIGSRKSGHRCTWDEFKTLADCDYDSGFGAQKVAYDLEVIFRDGETMWRHEYDGSEEWHYSTPFVTPGAALPIKSLFVPDDRIGWMSLADINEQPNVGGKP